LIFATLFVISAAFHAAETSITTLYPWKVKEFAKEEGDNSPFRILERDITRVLTTILVATTACTIYSAALFTNLAMELLGARGVAYSTVGLTVVTLVFGELIPKSLGVSNAEMVARIMVPPINLLAVVLSPVGKVLSMFAKLVLRLLGACFFFSPFFRFSSAPTPPPHPSLPIPAPSIFLNLLQASKPMTTSASRKTSYGS
jgi:Mg2+/Co2+ transporter CorB